VGDQGGGLVVVIFVEADEHGFHAAVFEIESEGLEVVAGEAFDLDAFAFANQRVVFHAWHFAGEQDSKVDVEEFGDGIEGADGYGLLAGFVLAEGVEGDAEFVGDFFLADAEDFTQFADAGDDIVGFVRHEVGFPYSLVLAEWLAALFHYCPSRRRRFTAV